MARDLVSRPTSTLAKISAEIPEKLKKLRKTGEYMK